MLLKGKLSLITGSSRGIGKKMAELFAENGSDLILLSRNITLLNKVKSSIQEKHNVQVSIYAVDVSDYSALKEIFSTLRKEKKIPDVVVNNAGIMIDAVLQMMKPETMHEIFNTNVFGTFYVSQLASKLMIRKRAGSIINLSSIIGTNGNHGQTIYGASKGAIIGFTKSLSKELAPINIRVNAIAPGFIDTDMTRGMDPEYFEKNIEAIRMKRIGKPIDVAKLALFLASDLSDYVTGQVIGVDGGFLI